MEKSKLSFKIICYALCVLLLVFYLALFLSKADVCIEYRLYYIDNVLADWPGYGGLIYKPGTVLDFTKDDIKRKSNGWDTSPEDYTNLAWESASLFFKFDDKKPLICTVELGGTNANSFKIRAKDSVLYSSDNKDASTISFNLDPSLLDEDGVLRLYFECDRVTTEPHYFKLCSIVFEEV